MVDEILQDFVERLGSNITNTQTNKFSLVFIVIKTYNNVCCWLLISAIEIYQILFSLLGVKLLDVKTYIVKVLSYNMLQMEILFLNMYMYFKNIYGLGRYEVLICMLHYTNKQLGHNRKRHCGNTRK